MIARSLLTVLAATLTSLYALAGELPTGVTRQAVVFTGGHDTEHRDGGRPVGLIAAALGVPPEVFREAFTHVRPAHDGGPTREQAQQNKGALMDALGKYGITNERLDTVSNYYRYRPQKGELWTHKDATANALIKGGAVISYEITSPGSGYSTPPAVSIPGIKDASAKVELVFGQTLESNGSVSAITVVPAR